VGNRPNRPETADITFTATVSAEQVRFDEVPETSVTFTGAPQHESASGSDRVNLPERVEAAVTYRDVRVDYRLASKLIFPLEPPLRPHSHSPGWSSPGRAGSSADGADRPGALAGPPHAVHERYPRPVGEEDVRGRVE